MWTHKRTHATVSGAPLLCCTVFRRIADQPITPLEVLEARRRWIGGRCATEIVQVYLLSYTSKLRLLQPEKNHGLTGSRCILFGFRFTCTEILTLILEIESAQKRLDSASAAWLPLSRKRKDRRPKNAEAIHNEYKDARKALTSLQKGR